MGVVFDTAYLDSHPAVGFNPDMPVLVALHDSPGSSTDLVPLLQPFVNLGYRVIAPDFPGEINCPSVDVRSGLKYLQK
jgi:pimeloyl-ACP methyl ester carboxylesterase